MVAAARMKSDKMERALGIPRFPSISNWNFPVRASKKSSMGQH